MVESCEDSIPGPLYVIPFEWHPWNRSEDIPFVLHHCQYTTQNLVALWKTVFTTLHTLFWKKVSGDKKKWAAEKKWAADKIKIKKTENRHLSFPKKERRNRSPFKKHHRKESWTVYSPMRGRFLGKKGFEVLRISPRALTKQNICLSI